MPHRDTLTVIHDILVLCRKGTDTMSIQREAGSGWRYRNMLAKKGLLDIIIKKIPYIGSGRRRYKLAKNPPMKKKRIFKTTKKGESFISAIEQYWFD